MEQVGLGLQEGAGVVADDNGRGESAMMMASGEMEADWLRARSFYSITFQPTIISPVMQHLFEILDP